MAVTTYLQLINKVMVKLREPEVNTPSETDYAKLVGIFVNEAKREVEDAHKWLELRGTAKVITQASTFTYTLTGAGNRYIVIDVFNDTEDYNLRKVPDKWMNRQMNFTDVQEGRPYYWSFNTQTDGDPDVDFWPIPDAEYEINFNLIVPQDDLAAAGDVLLVPEYPVYLGAYAKAIAERGEDSGKTFQEAMQEYKQALDDAVSKALDRTPHEDTWEVL